MATPDDYDAEADFRATGSVLCDDCGTRVHPRTLESLPPHNCTERARERRYVLVPRWAVKALVRPATIQEQGCARQALKAALDDNPHPEEA